MIKVLVPVDRSSNALHAVRHAINELKNNAALEIHLLNVQAPFDRHLSRFMSRKNREAVKAHGVEIGAQPGPTGGRGDQRRAGSGLATDRRGSRRQRAECKFSLIGGDQR